MIKPIGKTYLIEVKKKTIELAGNIYIPINSSNNDIYYEGIIREYGTGWADNEIKDLVPIGTKVFFNYGKKEGTRLVINSKVFYIHEKDMVIAKIEE